MTNFLHEQTFQFVPAIRETLLVRGINYPYQGVGLLEVILPVGPKSLLAADVPCVAFSMMRLCKKE